MPLSRAQFYRQKKSEVNFPLRNSIEANDVPTFRLNRLTSNWAESVLLCG